MAFHKNETSEFIYLGYKKENQLDFENFKIEMTNTTSANEKMKDIIVDLSGCTCITSPEIGIMVRVLRYIQGTARMLRLITTPEIKKTLEATNILRMKNLVTYEDQKSFFEEIAKSKPAAKPSPTA